MATDENNFELRPKHRTRILTYRKGGRPYRSYGRNLTNDFVKNFLTEGSKDQIEERKKLFNRLPGQKAATSGETTQQGTQDTATQKEAVKSQENQPQQTQQAQPKGPAVFKNQDNAQDGDLEKMACRIVDSNLSDFEKELAKIDDPAFLDAIEKEERRDGKERKGAIEAIQERREEIQEKK